MRCEIRILFCGLGPYVSSSCSLYVEEVDIGEEAPRQVVSGLVKFIPEARPWHLHRTCSSLPAHC